MAFEGMATPLGMKPGPSRRGIPPQWRRWLVVIFFLMITALVLAAMLQWSARRSVPTAVAVIERASEVVVTRSAAPVKAGAAEQVPETTAQGSGSSRMTPGGGLIIKVPDAVGPAAEPLYDNRVAQASAQGILPVVSASGHKPYRLYSKPFMATDKPKIAIVVTGMGVSPRGTEEAISKLPGGITLAFAPYGRDLIAEVNRARGEGHEILLQVPMEPQDYPQSDPGPHTLRAKAALSENFERLHWLMSRFTGYVGLTNFMGSRLMRDKDAYGALLAEVEKRGLLFLDDGTVSTSLSAPLAKKINLPLAIADRVMESDGHQNLDELLAEVEKLARKNGSAVLSVPGLPAYVKKLAVFGEGLEARGVVLAPISAIIGANRR